MAKSKVIVLGAGVIGLSSAIKLVEAGYDVTIWTKDLTADTTSAIAGAFWEPVRCHPIEKALPWAQATFQIFKQIATEDSDSGVIKRVAENYLREPESDPWWRPGVEVFDRLEADKLPAGYKDGWLYETFVVDTSHYLPWLVQKVKDAGIKIEQHDLHQLSDAFSEAHLVVNCTGLGARELCNDDRVYPVRGQVLRMASNGFDKIITDETMGSIVYVIPRTDDIILGGTFEENNSNTEPSDEDTAGILERVRQLAPQFENAEVLEVKVGLRPARDVIRLEIEKLAEGTVIHNYGHGGAGYSLSWGCAEDVVKLANSLN